MSEIKEIKRLNYFTSQFLVAQDFIDEQSYHREMRRLHNRGLHSWGIVEGLEVTGPTGANRSILVAPGLAIDKDGREIMVAGPDRDRSRDLGPAANQPVYVTASYKEEQCDRYTGNGLNDWKRWREGAEIGRSDKLEDDGSVIVLAKVNPDGKVDLSVRRYAGPAAGAVNGALTITGMLTAAGGIQMKNNQEIRLRRDKFHSLGYKASYDGVSVDGPVLTGFAGGGLGTTGSGPGKLALSWKEQDVTFHGSLTVEKEVAKFNKGLTVENAVATFNKGLRVENEVATFTKGLRVENEVATFTKGLRVENEVATFTRGLRVENEVATFTKGLTVENSDATLKNTLTVAGSKTVQTTAGNNTVDIQNADRVTVAQGTHPTGLALYVTANSDNDSGGVEFRHSNGTQGIGLGHNTIYATGASADQPLKLQARGKGRVNIREGGVDLPVSVGAEALRLVGGAVRSGGGSGRAEVAGGKGFVVERVGDSGTYDITFTPPFSGVPGASVTHVYNPGKPDAFRGEAGGGGATGDGAVIVFLDKDRMRVIINNPQDPARGFSFIVIGPR